MKNEYLRATASSLDRVKRSLLLLGNMDAKMSVKSPVGGDIKRFIRTKHVVKKIEFVNKEIQFGQ